MAYPRFRLVVLTALLLSAGCESGDEFQLPENLPGASGSAGVSGTAYDASTATATVSGRIILEGMPPEMPFLNMGGDFYCQRVGTGQLSQEVLTSDDGGLANAIVHVRSGHDASLGYRPPSAPVVIDQDRCVYIPRVLTLMAGQELLIRNNDSTLHNVHAESGPTTLFNFAQRSGPQEDVEVFNEPGMPIHIGCDLHRWMDTWLGIFDHPFHTTSGEDGAYTLQLPPGTYEIVAWHERYGEQAATMELRDGEALEFDFTFESGTL